MGMKNLTIAVNMFKPVAVFAASGPVPLGPNQGKFGDWTAATYGSGAAKACYAFTTATHGAAMLTVTERAGAHDEVTLTAGTAYPKDSTVRLMIGTEKFSFYTSGANAFTTQGPAAIAAFKAGTTAAEKSPGEHAMPEQDVFPLSGFSGAYGAIVAACP